VSSRLARARSLLARRLSQRGVAPGAAATAIAFAAESSARGLSPTLTALTVRAAAAITANSAAAQTFSGSATALMEEVMKTMLLCKLRQMALGLLALGVVAAVVAITCYSMPAQDKASALGAAPAQAEQAPRAKEAGLEKKQHATARKAFEQIWAAYDSGYHDEEMVYRWSVRLLESEKACAADAEKRLKAVKAHLARMQKLEKRAPERIVMVPAGGLGEPGLAVGFSEKGQRVAIVGKIEPRAHAAEVTAFFRAEAEVWLAEAKSESLKKSR
jgi:hypothetical protein